MGIEQKAPKLGPIDILRMHRDAMERSDEAVEDVHKQLAVIESEIAALEREPQTAQLDNTVRGLREKADFMRQLLDNRTKMNELSNEFQAKIFERVKKPGTLH